MRADLLPEAYIAPRALRDLRDLLRHDCYRHGPHSGLNYCTPAEVRRTWEDGQRPQKTAA